MSVNTKKRKRPLTDKNDIVLKRLRIELIRIDLNKRESLGFLSDLQDESGQDILCTDHHTQHHRHHSSNHLIKLMYQLDLSVLCLLRKFTYEHKYPSLSLTFEDSEIDKFNNIVIRHEKKSIHIRIEYVDEYYTENSITYSKLFLKRHKSLINSYFNIFVKRILKTDNSLTDLEYLIIYTNSKLDLTKEKTFKIRRSKTFYPFKFNNIHIKESEILKNFLFTNDNTQEDGFYRFSQDKTTREKLLKKLEFLSSTKKILQKRKLTQECEKKVKEAFLDKLVFAVNQPNREKLNSIVKIEMKKNGKDQDDYVALQERVLRDLKTSDYYMKCGVDVSGITYQFNLLIHFLHDMFVHKNVFSVNLGKNDNCITICNKNKISYLYVYNADGNIDSNHLFSFKQKENVFCINKYFTLFIEEFGEDIEYLIIYTNANLDLTKNKRLKGRLSNDSCLLKFDSVNICEEKYRTLTYSLSINKNGLYQFSEKVTREKVINLLQLPPSLQKEKEKGKLSNENEKEKKEKFLDKLIFAVNQPDKETLNTYIRSAITKLHNYPYTYEELCEIALRWSESHEFGCLTKGIMKKLLEEIKNNKFSYQTFQSKHINNEIKLAKSIIDTAGTSEFNKFLDFLIKGEGLNYLTVLKRKRINLTNVSSILCGSGTKGIKAFKDLCGLWFDKEGNETQYLRNLRKEKINLTNMSSILNRAGAKASKSFKDLYDLWFDVEGHKTQYLKSLEEKGVNLANVSSILSGSGVKAPKAFKNLYDLWFDFEGHKTQYLKSLEEKGVNLANVSSILSGSGVKAPKAFEDLYDLWFDDKGHKTQYLKSLEENGVNLTNVSSILCGSGAKAPKAFKDLYDLWFDDKGHKTQYLKSLEEKGVNLANVSSILKKSGAKAPKAFKDLYDLWFDENGHKTKYLKSLEENVIPLTNVSSVLNRSGSNASKAFKDLYNLWFDAEGHKTKYLKSLEEKEVNLANISSILNGSGAKAPKAYKDLYDLWFDEKGHKTQYLKFLEKEDINLANVSSILNGSGAKASKAFKDLYDLWFDEKGHKTQYLKSLEENGVNLANVSSILNGSGAKAPKAFKDLHDVWFDDEGQKTQYLKSLEENAVNLANVSSILHTAGAEASKAFKDLYDLWFDEKGHKTIYLKSLEEEEINLANVSSILNGSGAKAPKAFKDLYDLWFDEKGHKTKYLKSLEENKITLTNVSSILSSSGSKASQAFKDLYDLWFDKEGNMTPYLKFGGHSGSI